MTSARGKFNWSATSLACWVLIGAMGLWREHRIIAYAAACRLPVRREDIFLVYADALLILLFGWRLISTLLMRRRQTTLQLDQGCMDSRVNP